MARRVDPDAFVVDFPTLFITVDWIEQHCPVPDQFRAGQRMELYDWQAWCTLNHYRVREDAEWQPENPLLSTAFVHRWSQIIAPQKTGKGPWSACGVALEAAGPALFAGWAGKGDGWACSDHGCGCGWEYDYRPGEPMGMRWPTPLIQITAFAEDQTENIYRPLRSMIRQGPLSDLLKVGEKFTRIVDVEEGRIDVVTSSAQARLGAPVTYVPQDETGIWTKENKMVSVADTQRRGLAGMQGRGQETTNGYDPTQKSVAQMTHQSKAKDEFRFHRPPPANLKYETRAHRRKIHEYVYRGSRHVRIETIDADAERLIAKGELAQAERFFGNRNAAGSGVWLDAAKWKRRAKRREVPDGTPIVLGFDGSDLDDWTALRAETQDGYQFTPTYGPDGAKLPTIWNPADWGGQVPRLEVKAALAELMTRFVVVRAYMDPPYWTTEIDEAAAEYGERRVVRWATARPVQMQAAADRLHTDVTKAESTFTHDGCEITAAHIGAAVKEPRPGRRYKLAKPEDGRKIDVAVTSILAHEAAGDVTAAGLWPEPEVSSKMVVFRNRSRAGRR
ncbi:hypothetical protein [Micromonospora rubida]|uniref:hypothetical protein n=1 Tax=Micromonospora rubida TaxID=2697657 RepID=UPI001378E970|nr:hypothetical protein [Micromonospora rubida]NBE80324.1 hypothetical protein [Micromonospora rubida]